MKKATEALKPFLHNVYIRDPFRCGVFCLAVGLRLTRILSEDLKTPETDSREGPFFTPQPGQKERVRFSAQRGTSPYCGR